MAISQSLDGKDKALTLTTLTSNNHSIVRPRALRRSSKQTYPKAWTTLSSAGMTRRATSAFTRCNWYSALHPNNPISLPHWLQLFQILHKPHKNNIRTIKTPAYQYNHPKSFHRQTRGSTYQLITTKPTHTISKNRYQFHINFISELLPLNGTYKLDENFLTPMQILKLEPWPKKNSTKMVEIFNAENFSTSMHFYSPMHFRTIFSSSANSMQKKSWLSSMKTETMILATKLNKIK